MAGRRLAALVALLIGWLLPMAAGAQTFPPLSGAVVDAANVLSPEQEKRINDKLEVLQRMNGQQLIVATFPDMQGYDQDNFGPRLRRAWGIGGPDRPDSAVLFVAIKERKLRIELSRSLDPILDARITSLVMDQIMVPRLKEGDTAGAINAGVDVLMAQMLRPSPPATAVSTPPPLVQPPEPIPVATPEAIKTNAASAAVQTAAASFGEDLYLYVGLGFGLLVILLFVVIARSRENKVGGPTPNLQSGERGRLDGSGLGKR